jgi:NAD(P)-dependent dehydrogenase (short-subunit alcohol dehydrogenase family)
MRCDGAAALVTRGASGLGRAAAEKLVEAGARMAAR